MTNENPSPQDSAPDRPDDTKASKNTALQSAPSPRHSSIQGSLSRLKRLGTKELKETLRDRRTIITLVLMPLLVYPILSLVFRTVLISALKDTLGDQPVALKIVLQSNRPEAYTSGFVDRLRRRVNALESDAAPATVSDPIPAGDVAEIESALATGFAAFSKHQWLISDSVDIEDLKQAVLNTDQAIGLRIEFPSSPEDRWYQGTVTIIQPDSKFGDQAADYFRGKITDANMDQISAALKSRGLPDRPPISVTPIVIAKDGSPSSSKTFSLASLIPLILVLMTVTGAVYPAIDLTAGERERGTLETLMAAPVPRLSILLAKFFAVWTVAIFTALLNLIGMAITVWTFQFESVLLGDGGFSLTVIGKIFGLLVLFAAFFSAILLAVTSFARSFKEAQAYLIPIILLSMGPGLMAMNPEMTLSGVWAIVPMVNVLLLGRDVINQQVDLVAAMVAVTATIAYALVAIQFAAQRFGADNVLYANQGSLSELIARPKARRSHFSVSSAMFALLLLFPLNLIAIGALGRLAKPLEGDYSLFVLLMAGFTIVSFFLLPSLIGWYRRVNFSSAFATRVPKIQFVIPAILLGLFAWPLLAFLVDQWYELTGLLAGAEAAKARKDTLVELTQGQVEKFRLLSPLVVAFGFSIVPAVCEEWFFRGMLLQTWLKRKSVRPHRSPWTAIAFTAVMFGLFHVLSNSAISLDRLLPTTLMGVLLGFICYRSGSIWPGVILHSLHNGCLVFLGYYQPQLSQLAWFPGDGDAVPHGWTIGAACVCVLAVLIAASMKRQTESFDDQRFNLATAPHENSIGLSTPDRDDHHD
jgi:membrane protease YdiL (CAAX protease family)/ABC-type transport system involved in multi-copper enzyme maturation permease subunit